MSQQLFKCHKCEFNDEVEEELRLHLLYTHYFLMPRCSTEVAKNADIDYQKLRDIFKRNKDEYKIVYGVILKYTPKCYHKQTNCLIHYVFNSGQKCDLNNMTTCLGEYNLFDYFYKSRRTDKVYKFHGDYSLGKKLKPIPKYLHQNTSFNIRKLYRIRQTISQMNKDAVHGGYILE